MVVPESSRISLAVSHLPGFGCGQNDAEKKSGLVTVPVTGSAGVDRHVCFRPKLTSNEVNRKCQSSQFRLRIWLFLSHYDRVIDWIGRLSGPWRLQSDPYQTPVRQPGRQSQHDTTIDDHTDPTCEPRVKTVGEKLKVQNDQQWVNGEVQ